MTKDLNDGLTYSRIANIIFGMIKRQDIVVLTTLLDEEASKLTYAELGRISGVSASEAHAAVKRLQQSSLVGISRRLRNKSVLEFLVHGLRYLFPLILTGKTAKGMPTAYAAPGVADAFATTGMVPVWACDTGMVVGRVCEPLYPTVPQTVSNNPRLYARLAMMDMLRGGRLRERQFAEQKFTEILVP